MATENPWVVGDQDLAFTKPFAEEWITILIFHSHRAPDLPISLASRMPTIPTLTTGKYCTAISMTYIGCERSQSYECFHSFFNIFSKNY